MAGTKFKKRDLNRFRRVYPFIKREPRNAYVADEPVTIEAGSIEFSGGSSVTYAFSESFTGAPTITAISVDSESNNSANVNIFVSLVTKSRVTFESSQDFNGTIHFHAIEIG